MKILVLDDYQDAFRKLNCYARLSTHEVVTFRDTEKDPGKLAARLKNADAVILTQQRSIFNSALVDRLPDRLQLIAQTGRQVKHIDIAACTRKGILVAAAGSGTGSATPELAWALIMASRRQIPHEVEQLKRGNWQTTLGKPLQGATLGIYALGRIGSRVAEYGKAFGMNVTCWGREATRAKAHEAGYIVPESREAFFSAADIISLHIRLTNDTRGLITAADLANMTSSALLVNTSRAALICEGALVAALKRGRPGFAAVDVYEDEPIVAGDHPLLKLPNALCTPHLGYVVENNYEKLYGTVIDSILDFAAGTPVNIVNPEALKDRAQKLA